MIADRAELRIADLGLLIFIFGAQGARAGGVGKGTAIGFQLSMKRQGED